MNYIKNLFVNKSVGFYVALGVELLSLILCVLYTVSFASTSLISWNSVIILSLGIVLFLVGILVPLKNFCKYGTVSLWLLLIASFILFILKGYDVIMVFAVNKEVTTSFILFAICTCLFIITSIMANICVWLSYSKKSIKE